MKNITLVDLFNKTVGHINAVGETRYDNQSLENLEEASDLLYDIIYKLIDNVGGISQPEYSVQKIGRKSQEILNDIHENIRFAIEQGFYER